jgi:DNA-binding transcriptional regulator YdaS (Cro superfamily)
MNIGIEALQRAITILGSQAKAAEAIGTTQQEISYRLRHGGKVKPEWCLPIETATDGKVTRHQLRPDLYPEAGVAA